MITNPPVWFKTRRIYFNRGPAGKAQGHSLFNWGLQKLIPRLRHRRRQLAGRGYPQIGHHGRAQLFGRYFAVFCVKLPRARRTVLFTGMQTGETLAQLLRTPTCSPPLRSGRPIHHYFRSHELWHLASLVSDIPENLESIDHAGFVFNPKARTIYLKCWSICWIFRKASNATGRCIL